MHRFWTRFILPLLLAAHPARVLEIGAEFGWNSRRLLDLGREQGFFLDVVDPAPHPVFHEAIAGYDNVAHHPVRSLDAILALPPADVVLLDGDHNYHTVYSELSQLFLRARQAGVPSPLVIFHDLAWPYARRDMYYDAPSIPAGGRQPHARRGFVPGISALTEEGLNAGYDNALHEGGPRNGVLTAVEDFIAAGCSAETLFVRLPFFNGLGVLVPPERAQAPVRAVLDGFGAPESLLATIEELEGDVNQRLVDLAVCRQHLTRRTDALMRARALIVRLEQELAGREAKT